MALSFSTFVHFSAVCNNPIILEVMTSKSCLVSERFSSLLTICLWTIEAI